VRPPNRPKGAFVAVRREAARASDDAGPASETRYRGTFFHRVRVRATARVVGSPWSFTLACAIVLGRAVFAAELRLLGHLVTGTTIVTFLVVFPIRNTQNRDAAAVHPTLGIPEGPRARRVYAIHTLLTFTNSRRPYSESSRP
jgi:hypothetical protein